MNDLPNIVDAAFEPIDGVALKASGAADHKPRILLLYGSLRQRSFSRLCALEAERLLKALGAETRMFDPEGLPLPDSVEPSIRRSPNCVNWPCGRKAWSGCRPNAMAR